MPNYAYPGDGMRSSTSVIAQSDARYVHQAGVRLATAYTSGTSFSIDQPAIPQLTGRVFVAVDVGSTSCEIGAATVSNRSVTLVSAFAQSHSAGVPVVLFQEGPVPVGWFGAVGDGVTDDTAAWQQAILETAASNGSLWLTGGLRGYALSYPLMWPNGTHVQRVGTSFGFNPRMLTVTGTLNATTTVTGVTGTQTGIQNGMTVTGADIPAGTFLQSGAGTSTWTLSQAATASKSEGLTVNLWAPIADNVCMHMGFAGSAFSYAFSGGFVSISGYTSSVGRGILLRGGMPNGSGGTLPVSNGQYYETLSSGSTFKLASTPAIANGANLSVTGNLSSGDPKLTTVAGTQTGVVAGQPVSGSNIPTGTIILGGPNTATTVSGGGQTISTTPASLTVASVAGFPPVGTCTVAGVTGTVSYTSVTGAPAALNGCTIASGSFTATNNGAVTCTTWTLSNNASGSGTGVTVTTSSSDIDTSDTSGATGTAFTQVIAAVKVSADEVYSNARNQPGVNVAAFVLQQPANFHRFRWDNQAPIQWGTVSSTLSTSSVLTAIPVSALPHTIPPGAIRLVATTGQWQVFYMVGPALAGATSINVVGQVPNFAYTNTTAVTNVGFGLFLGGQQGNFTNCESISCENPLSLDDASFMDFSHRFDLEQWTFRGVWVRPNNQLMSSGLTGGAFNCTFDPVHMELTANQPGIQAAFDLEGKTQAFEIGTGQLSWTPSLPAVLANAPAYVWAHSGSAQNSGYRIHGHQRVSTSVSTSGFLWVNDQDRSLTLDVTSDQAGKGFKEWDAGASPTSNVSQGNNGRQFYAGPLGRFLKLFNLNRSLPNIDSNPSSDQTGPQAIFRDTSAASATQISAGGLVQPMVNSTGSGSAALGSNCPATTATAPNTWLKLKNANGDDVWVPAWK